MRVVNNLTVPGGVKRVDLNPDTVRIQTWDGQDRIYVASSATPLDRRTPFAPAAQKER